MIDDRRTHWPYVAADTTPTLRELEVLEAVVAADGYKAAAWALSVSERTVKRNMAQIRVRLGVVTNMQAVYVCKLVGWLT